MHHSWVTAHQQMEMNIISQHLALVVDLGEHCSGVSAEALALTDASSSA